MKKYESPEINVVKLDFEPVTDSETERLSGVDAGGEFG